MTAKTPTAPPAPAAAPAPAPATDLIGMLGFAPRPAAPAKPARAKNAQDWARDVDLAIIAAAGNLVEELVPEEFRATVARRIAQQLHHMSTPKLGWPSLTLPRPDRSDWK